MTSLFRSMLDRFGKPSLPERDAAASPHDAFQHDHYQRHNQRRLEHLAGLGLDLAGASVLEVGAGIGDHTSFFLDRGCRVVSTDGRPDNLAVLRARHPQIEVKRLDLDNPEAGFAEPFDVVYCYGLLYHLKRPAEGLTFLAGCCRRLLLLETCVSFGDEDALHPCAEDEHDPTQSVAGVGCRPTRAWVYNQLRRHFAFVYLPRTQPWHEQFPLDWSAPYSDGRLSRAVFIAARQELANPALAQGIPAQQTRH